ncbi:hypothetical protein IG631_12199 [Alternaria alternata]|nr:hypothetical protein IG631_12199 [Alternaria alternata]
MASVKKAKPKMTPTYPSNGSIHMLTCDTSGGCEEGWSLEVWRAHDEVSPKVASRLAEKPVDPRQSVGCNTKKSSNSWLE